MTIPEARAERARQVADGMYYLVTDSQDRPGKPDVRYSRTAYKITDRSGLESGASVSATFDPSSENVTLNHIRVWRDGKMLDRLPGADVQVLRREKDLDKGILDGRKTVQIELKDVRVGDIIDYAFTWENSDPLFLGKYGGESSTSWSAPVALTRYRLLWPHGAPISIRTFSGAPNPTIRRLGDRDEYLWRIVDGAPVPKEDDTPDWLYPWGRVAVSSLTSWSEVVNWSLPLYSQSEALTSDWAARVAAIASKYPDPRDRITEALRLVQDEIRYVSLSIGAGSYRPRPPVTVIRTGYGDCKDKTLLLVAILHRLGVAAVPALTDADHGRILPQEPPNTNAFDHAVVRLELAGRAYWVDPTLSHQGGRFPALGALDEGWALPIRAGQKALEALPGPEAPIPTVDVVERYELPRGADEPLSLKVTTIFRGDDANRIRGDLASESPAQMEKKYLDYYAGMYPGVRRDQPLQAEDQRDANVLTIHESYVLRAADLAKAGLNKAFQVRASGLTTYKTPPVGDRRLPFLVAYPANDIHRIVVVTPGHRPPAPEDLELKTKTFHFTRAAKREGDTLTITEALKGLRDTVPADEIEAYRTDSQALSDATYVTLNLASNSGGVIGGDAKLIGYGFVAIVCLVLGLGAFFGLRAGLTADAAYAAEGQFYPVSLRKFMLMCLATGGLYATFWQWKCWRWAKRHDGQDIQPFWRALFSVFWMYPLFAQPNRRLGSRALPRWLGITAATAYLLWAVANSAINRWHEAPPLLRLVVMGVFICNLPAVIAIARLNAAESTVTRRNSRFTWHTAVALAYGALFWVLTYIGLNE